MRHQDADPDEKRPRGNPAYEDGVRVKRLVELWCREQQELKFVMRFVLLRRSERWRREKEPPRHMLFYSASVSICVAR